MFNAANSAPNNILVAGKQGLVELQNGNPKDQLNSLSQVFCDKIATSTYHALYRPFTNSIPPAAKYYSFCVCHQIRSGKVKAVKCSQVYRDKQRMTPVLILLIQHLLQLKMIRCTCHTKCSSVQCKMFFCLWQEQGNNLNALIHEEDNPDANNE